MDRVWNFLRTEWVPLTVWALAAIYIVLFWYVAAHFIIKHW